MTDYKNQIEALLFASGRLMDSETLLRLTGASNKQVLETNIAKLKEEYEKRDSPIMIVEEKDGWKLTVREQYLPLVRKIVSEMELPKTVLETLAVIAWKAPVLQSEIVDIRHNKAYDHIAVLEELEFIKKQPKGRSMQITLTEKFYTYFDVEGGRNIKEIFGKVMQKIPEPETKELAMEITKAEQSAQKIEEKIESNENMDETSELDDSLKESEPKTKEEKKEQEEFSEL
jgi:segregation and condensation protein B